MSATLCFRLELNPISISRSTINVILCHDHARYVLKRVAVTKFIRGYWRVSRWLHDRLLLLITAALYEFEYVHSLIEVFTRPICLLLGISQSA